MKNIRIGLTKTLILERDSEGVWFCINPQEDRFCPIYNKNIQEALTGVLDILTENIVVNDKENVIFEISEALKMTILELMAVSLLTEDKTRKEGLN